MTEKEMHDLLQEITSSLGMLGGDELRTIPSRILLLCEGLRRVHADIRLLEYTVNGLLKFAGGSCE